MNPLRRITKRHLRLAAISLGIFLILFTLIGFFAVPPLLKSILTQKLSEALHRQVSIDEIRANPFALSLTIRGLKVNERTGSEIFVSFEELYANLESSSLFRLAPVVREVRLVRPYVRIVRLKEFAYNFSDLLESLSPAKAQPKTEPAPPPRFAVNNIQVVDASADFVDEPVQKRHAVRKVNVTVPSVSTIPSQIDTFVEPRVTAEINGTHYDLKGKTKPFVESLETTFDIRLDDLQIPFYVAYSPVPLPFSIPSGVLDSTVTVSFIQFKNRPSSLIVRGTVGVKELGVDDAEKRPVLRLQAVDVDIVSAEPLARQIHLGRIGVQRPQLTVRREKSGILNLETLLPKLDTAPKPTEPTTPGEPIALEIDRVELTDGMVDFTDLATPTPFATRLGPINGGVSQFSTRQQTKASYALTLATETKEAIALEGTLSVNPVAVEGAVDVKSVPLKKYAPYYRDMLLFDLESGKLDLSSRYAVALGQGEPSIVASEAAVSVSALRLRQRGQTEDFLTVPALAVKDTTIDLTQRQVTVGGIATQKGSISVKRLPTGEVDLQKLLPPPAAGGASSPGAAGTVEQKPWIVMLKRLTVDQYTAKIEDRAAAEPITLLAEKIRLTGENLSTAKNAQGKVGLSLLLDGTATVTANTTVGLDPLRADGRVEVAGVVLNRYAPYYKNLVVFDIQEGVADVATGYRLAQTQGGFDVKLVDLSTTLKTLRLKTRDTQQEFLSIPLLAIRNTAVDLSRQDVVVGDLSTERGSVVVVRSRDGEISLAKLLPRATAAAASLADAPGAPAPSKAAQPWTVKANALSVAQYRIQVTDETPVEPVNVVVEELSVKAENLTTAQNQPPGKASLALRLGTGTVTFEGEVSVAPVIADLRLAVKEIDIRPFQSYITEKVKVTITDGRASTTGRLELSIKEPEGLSAKFTGETTLGKFAAIEKANAEDILTWQSLALSELSVGVNPLFVRAKKVALSEFFAHVVLQPGGRLNLLELVATPEPAKPADTPKDAPTSPPSGQAAPPAAASAAPGLPKDITIEEITLQGGRVQFQDRSVKPAFNATMTEIGGRVSGLTSIESSPADLELRGRMNNSAPLEITGKVHPLRKDLYADIRARFTGMDLSPTTPYAGRYVGYSIEKGKLSFDLAYRIDKGKLDSENKVFVDQFTFGDKVDSPDATGLPVKLAVALLKDRNGEIHLDIPVTGSLDDPQFSIWSIVLQVIGNLITKAVTSPFALLGAAFGGGEEMQYLEFDDGRAAIPEAGAKKIEALATALGEKPSLKLEITGFVSPDPDREGLKQYLLQRKVKTQKLNDLRKQGVAAVPVDEVRVAPEEYEKYLTLAYRAETFPKPRNFIGLVKSLPVDEMEKLILTHIEVGEEELRALAAQRANAVKEAILQTGKVAPERLFIVEPKTLTPEKKDKVKDNRVDFKIG